MMIFYWCPILGLSYYYSEDFFVIDIASIPQDFDKSSFIENWLDSVKRLGVQVIDSVKETGVEVVESTKGIISNF